jgi:hypothetical protein
MALATRHTTSSTCTLRTLLSVVAVYYYMCSDCAYCNIMQNSFGRHSMQVTAASRSTAGERVQTLQ